MSAFGTKRTFREWVPMSAFGGFSGHRIRHRFELMPVPQWLPEIFVPAVWPETGLRGKQWGKQIGDPAARRTAHSLLWRCYLWKNPSSVGHRRTRKHLRAKSANVWLSGTNTWPPIRAQKPKNGLAIRRLGAAPWPKARNRWLENGHASPV